VLEGSAEIAGPEGETQPILVAVDAAVYNVQKATCAPICIDCAGVESAFITVDPFAVSVSKTTQQTFTLQYRSGTQSNATGSATWGSSNNSVATVKAGLVTGVSAGSLNLSASLYTVTEFGEVCQPEQDGIPSCGEGLVSAPTAPGTDKPTITSIDPNPIMIGAAPPDGKLTINGSGFGTSPTVNLPSGVTSTGTASTDTQIVLTGVSVSFAPAIGPANVTVTASGVTSSPSSLTINGPNEIVVQSDSIGTCASGGGQCRIVSYIAKNYDGSIAANIPVAENISFSGWNCTQNQPAPVTLSCNGSVSTTSSGSFSDDWSMLTGDTPAGCGWNITDHYQWCSPTGNNPDPGITFGTVVGWAHTASTDVNGYINPPTAIPPGTVFSP
jgi:Bacterial Ig-like domain (group 2)